MMQIRFCFTTVNGNKVDGYIASPGRYPEAHGGQIALILYGQDGPDDTLTITVNLHPHNTMEPYFSVKDYAYSEGLAMALIKANLAAHVYPIDIGNHGGKGNVLEPINDLALLVNEAMDRQ